SARAELEALRVRFPHAALRADDTKSARPVRVTLPERADGDVIVEDPTSSISARFRLEGAPPVPRADVGGVSISPGTRIAHRDLHTAERLANGKVLVVYGYNCGGGGGCLLGPGANIYDPTTSTFAATGSPPDRGVGRPSVLLPNGKVLIPGASPPGLYDSGAG